MIDVVSFIVWLYLVYACLRVPKREREVVKKIYTTQYALPFDVWMQLKINDKPYLIVSNNQN